MKTHIGNHCFLERYTPTENFANIKLAESCGFIKEIRFQRIQR